MSSDPVLEATGLTYGYRREAPVIEDLVESVPRGSVTAITGRSGSGKSTLLYLLAGLLTPWAGTVRFEGRDLAAEPDGERSRLRARAFGFVFQDAVLDPRRSVLEAVIEPGLYADDAPADLVDRASCLLDRMKVDVRQGSRPGEISGGQAQRVGVARALLLAPRVVFADEPTGNLDTESADVVLDALVGAAEDGCAVLVATHDERVVGRAARRVMLG